MNVPETFFSTHKELVLFGLSCLFGAAAGVVYDVFRTLRLMIPHSFFLVLAEDILFMTGYAVFLPAFSSAAARGEIRAYYVIGSLIGFTVYFFTVGNVVIGALRKVFSCIKKPFMILISPLRSVYVSLREKGRFKFVGTSKNKVKTIKKHSILLISKPFMLYNKREIKKRKNVKNVDKKNKTKTSRQRIV